jgi:hypothetical protein
MEPITMAEFIATVNFDELRKQKTALIAAQSTLNAIGAKEQTNIANELEGLINFIDAFQDIAVDQYGKEAKDVFNLTDEDEIIEPELREALIKSGAFVEPSKDIE